MLNPPLQPAEPIASRGHVWIVDDSPAQLARASGLLSKRYPLECFPDGEAALERIAQGARPDLILLDWQLPGLSGLEVCSFLRERYDEVSLPILMLTSRGEHEDFAAGLGAGANDYLTKPYHDAELVARVGTLVRIHRQSELLRTREAWHATTLRSIGDAVIATDAVGRISFLNPAAETLTGWRDPDAQGRPLEEVLRLINEHTRAPMDSPLERVFREGVVVPLTNHTLLIRKDGLEVPIDDSAAPIRDADGTLTGVVLVFRDVVEKKLAEAARDAALTDARSARALAERSLQDVQAAHQALGESKERLRRVAEASGTGLWDLDAATGEVDADARVLTLLGLPVGGAPLTLNFTLDALHIADRERVSRAISAALAGENGGRYLTEFRTVGLGHAPQRWVESRGQLLPGHGGKPGRLAGAMLDISMRKVAEEERQRALAHVTEVLDSMSDAFFSLDADWRFVFVNRNYERKAGMHRQDMLGHLFWELFPDAADPSSPFRLNYLHCMDTREEVQFLDHPQPLDPWIDVRAYPTMDGGIAVFVRDVSVPKRAEEVLRHKAEFEQQLIGIVSHDLRNPISAISLSAATMLLRQGLEDPQRKTIARVLSSADRASRMIRDLLDFTQARIGGGLPISRRPMDFRALTRQVVDELQVSHLDRVLGVDQLGEGEVAWDEDRMAQVVGNLLSNALVYSPAGTPVVVTTRGLEDEVVLEIHNTGTPIPAEILPLLFKPMQRGLQASETPSRSVGLGLYIVKHIVDAHGGSIDVKSTAAEGTRFTVRMPRLPPAARAASLA